MIRFDKFQRHNEALEHVIRRAGWLEILGAFSARKHLMRDGWARFAVHEWRSIARWRAVMFSLYPRLPSGPAFSADRHSRCHDRQLTTPSEKAPKGTLLENAPPQIR